MPSKEQDHDPTRKSEHVAAEPIPDDVLAGLKRQRMLWPWFAAIVALVLITNTGLTIATGALAEVVNPALVGLLLVPSFVAPLIAGAPLRLTSKSLQTNLDSRGRNAASIPDVLRKEKRLRLITSLLWGLSVLSVLSAAGAAARGDGSWYRFVLSAQIGLAVLGLAAIYTGYKAYIRASDDLAATAGGPRRPNGRC